jgi:hypothetical protein
VMNKFRKRPVVIEARQLNFENAAEIMAWCGSTKHWSRPPLRAVTGIIVPTLEGQHEASFGDWIIKGVKGEFYPCKPDIFEATYEPASAASPAQEG